MTLALEPEQRDRIISRPVEGSTYNRTDFGLIHFRDAVEWAISAAEGNDKPQEKPATWDWENVQY